MDEFFTRAKEPFKTAIAITIAYGIALTMDWEKPYWAGFAVAFVSLSTVGQSFNKAAMRMFGTLVGIIVALILISLFPQERWYFMIALSAYTGLCTYLMTGTKHQYFWNVCGFVCVLICMSAGPDPVNAFETAILRAEETGLGILVYSLVALLLWPVTSRENFFSLVSQIIATQRTYCRVGLIRESGEDHTRCLELKAKLLQAQAQLDQVLSAAESDTEEVREVRHHWHGFKMQIGKLTTELSRSIQSFSDMEAANRTQLLTNLSAFLNELDERYSQIECMLTGEKPSHEPKRIELVMDTIGIQGLTHFERAEMVLFRDRLDQLDQLTRSLFDSIRNIHECNSAGTSRFIIPSIALQWPDPDRLLAVIRVMMSMWLAYLALIYIDSMPGGTSFVTMAGVYGMIVASTPMISLRTLFTPLMSSVVFGCLVYVFILPHLSGFLSLGTLLFIVTFSICYMFSDPKQMLGKTFALAMFVSIASIDNQQVYSFMVVATNMLMFPILFMLLAITAYFPVNLKTEKSFLRLLERYFRSCSQLLLCMSQDREHRDNRVTCIRRSFYLRELASIPTKLAPWAKFLNTKVLPGTEKNDVQALLSGMHNISNCLKELIEVRSTKQNQLLIDQFADTALEWRLHLQDVFERLSKAPATFSHSRVEGGIDRLTLQLEKEIREAMVRSAGEQLSRKDYEQFYRLLGAYRDVSESVISYTKRASMINWGHWHENRF